MKVLLRSNVTEVYKLKRMTDFTTLVYVKSIIVRKEMVPQNRFFCFKCSILIPERRAEHSVQLRN